MADTAVAHAYRAGDLLIEAKRQVVAEYGHGHWVAWLRENVPGYSIRRLQEFKRLAEQTDPNARAPAYMTIEQALRDHARHKERSGPRQHPSEVSIRALHANPWPLRRDHCPSGAIPLIEDDPRTTNALQQSLERDGLVHPVVVRRHPESLDDYQVVDGHQRVAQWAALGHETIRVEVRELSDLDMQRLTVVLNETYFEADPICIGQVLARLKEQDPDGYRHGVRYTDNEIWHLLNLTNVDWPNWKREYEEKQRAKAAAGPSARRAMKKSIRGLALLTDCFPFLRRKDREQVAEWLIDVLCAVTKVNEQKLDREEAARLLRQLDLQSHMVELDHDPAVNQAIGVRAYW